MSSLLQAPKKYTLIICSGYASEHPVPPPPKINWNTSLDDLLVSIVVCSISETSWHTQITDVYVPVGSEKENSQE